MSIAILRNSKSLVVNSKHFENDIIFTSLALNLTISLDLLRQKSESSRITFKNTQFK